MSEELKTVKPAKQVERAVINDELKNKLVSMTAQANAALQGITIVTKSDIVNLVLGAHSDELSAAEIEALKAQHLDQVKFAFWVAKRVKEARDAGENLSMQDVLSMNHHFANDTKPVKRRARRKKDDKASEAAGPASSDKSI